MPLCDKLRAGKEEEAEGEEEVAGAEEATEELLALLQFLSSMPQGVVAVTGWPNQRGFFSLFLPAPKTLSHFHSLSTNHFPPSTPKTTFCAFSSCRR